MNQKMKIDNRQDFFGERGCCIDCSETTKETMRGIQRDVYQSGKHYSCLCIECFCVKCCWFYNRVCQRSFFVVNRLPIGGEEDWNPEKIRWTQKEGTKEPYEQTSIDFNNPDYDELVHDLEAHKGKLQRDGKFYWLFENGTTIGRKQSQWGNKEGQTLGELNDAFERRWRTLELRSQKEKICLPPKEQLRKLLYQSFSNGFKCDYCQTPLKIKDTDPYHSVFSFEHKKSIHCGGDNSIKNLSVVCHRCNIVKGTMS